LVGDGTARVAELDAAGADVEPELQDASATARAIAALPVEIARVNVVLVVIVALSEMFCPTTWTRQRQDCVLTPPYRNYR
jgi:hypothetical protein